MKRAKHLILTALIAVLSIAILFAFASCERTDGIVSVEIKGGLEGTIYNDTFEDLDLLNAYTVVVTYFDGETDEVPLDASMLALAEKKKLYVPGEQVLNVVYNGHGATMRVTISEYDFADIRFPSQEYVYTGEAHTMRVNRMPTDAVVTYDAPIVYQNVGIYTVNATVSKDGYADKVLTATMTIKPIEIDVSGVTFTDKTATYTGVEEAIELGGALPDASLAKVNYTGARLSGAGTSEATATMTCDGNHAFKLADGSIVKEAVWNATLTVLPGTHDMSGVTFAPISATYDGEDHAAIAENLPKGVGVLYTVYRKDGDDFVEAGISGKNYTLKDAGEYKVVATFSVTKDYNPIEDQDALVTIAPATFTFSLDVPNFCYKRDPIYKNVAFEGVLDADIDEITIVEPEYVKEVGNQNGTFTATHKNYVPATYDCAYTVTMTDIPVVTATVDADFNCVLTWEAIEDASAYALFIDGVKVGDDFTETEKTFSLDGYDGFRATVSAVAVVEEVRYDSHSEDIVRLAAPGNAKIADGKLTWDANDDASAFEVSYPTDTETLTESFDTNEGTIPVAEGGTFAVVSIVAKGDPDANVLDSKPTELTDVVKLAKADAQVKTGAFYWPEVEGATGYYVSVDGEEPVLQTVNAYRFDDATDADEHTIVVYAYAGDAALSGEPTEIKASRLAKAANVRVENGKIVWDEVDGAYHYFVTVKANETSVIYNVMTNEIALSGLTASDLEITVSAYGEDDETVLNGDASDVLNVTALYGVEISGSQIIWNEVTGATGYEVVVTVAGGTEYSFETTDPALALETVQAEVTETGWIITVSALGVDGVASETFIPEA